jgi:hypothetical protein
MLVEILAFLFIKSFHDDQTLVNHKLSSFLLFVFQTTPCTDKSANACDQSFDRRLPHPLQAQHLQRPTISFKHYMT